MMEFVLLGGDQDRREENELASLFDTPAYMRRAKGVEEALEQLLARCRQQREQWLLMARLRLGQLHALAGDWMALRPLLADDEQITVLEWLRQHLAPKLRLPPAATKSQRVLRRALRELIESLERFNVKWREYLPKVDLKAVNDLRDGYNRYYVLEKACALRSDLLARHGFTPLPPFDLRALEAQLPPLPVPCLADK